MVDSQTIMIEIPSFVQGYLAVCVHGQGFKTLRLELSELLVESFGITLGLAEVLTDTEIENWKNNTKDYTGLCFKGVHPISKKHFHIKITKKIENNLWEGARFFRGEEFLWTVFCKEDQLEQLTKITQPEFENAWLELVR